ncbi:MAG: hypothetical protein RLZZ262_924 [Bacteroidota bacterium]|jgi:hypothetical protein
MQADQLIQTSIEQTQSLIQQAELLQHLDLSALTWKEHETSWSVLECLEHLNRYGDFYLPCITQKIKNASLNTDPVFKPGLLGNYFANMMLPKEKLNKMKTFKDKNPLHSKLDPKVIGTFIQQQHQLLELLEKSKTINLNAVKIPTTISSLIKIKLGDTYRFYINHMIRHFQQIDRVKAKALHG